MLIPPLSYDGTFAYPGCASISFLQLDLSRNELRAAGARALAPALAKASLTRLDVSENMLDRGGQGVKMLRDAVCGRQGFMLLDDDND